MDLLWNAWRTRSVTLSTVFALSIQGISSGHYLREGFRALGLATILVWTLPFVLIALIAKHEHRMIPDQRRRGQIAVFLLVASMVSSILTAEYTSRKTAAAQSVDASTNVLKRASSKPARTNLFERLRSKH
ncbi:MAG: hypothetical protein JO317_01685 [Verrucomicrobiae bacterium]|nr:hypothetical protein [Verrucomicrobiae bacterium]